MLALAEDSKNTLERKCLIDTGFDKYLAINKSTYLALGKPEIVNPRNDVEVAGGEVLAIPSIYLDVTINEQLIPLEAYVLDEEAGNILGIGLLKVYSDITNQNLLIDFGRNSINFISRN